MKKGIKILLAAAMVALLVATAIAYRLLSSSLPTLSGNLSFDALSQPVSISRDENGLVNIDAKNRDDAMAALGFVHAQERFFQMDLSRRSASGRLSELFGERALEYDKSRRIHLLETVAQRRLASLPTDHQRMLSAYVAGVNKGLQTLKSKPFEYWLLGTEPQPWQAKDSLLVVYAMFFDLNDERANYDDSRSLLANYGSATLLNYLSPKGTDWDSALDGSSFSSATVPGDDVIDLSQSVAAAGLAYLPQQDEVGSNSWAVSGAHTQSGAAMLANDMHLGLRLPNTWFRAQLNYNRLQAPRMMVGATFPGVPAVVVGSNGQVAWGFTNAYGDWHDRIQLDINDGYYSTLEGPKAVELVQSEIQVKGKKPVSFVVQKTHWGPIVDNADGSKSALHWLAHYEESLNLELAQMDAASSLSDAINVCQVSGVPPLNCLIADNQGDIGWTIAGKMPIRSSQDTSMTVPWQQADKLWLGWLSPQDYPKKLSPKSSKLWTANARMIGGLGYEMIGDGGYANGARGKQIQKILDSKDQFTEAELLAIALDDRALFLERWKNYLTILLKKQDSLTNQQATVLLMLDDWTGRAKRYDSAYTLVRQFHRRYRQTLYQSVQDWLAVQHQLTLDDGVLNRLRQKEQAMWQLANHKPSNWLPQEFASWDEWMLAILDEAAADLIEQHGHLQAATWGEHNRLAVEHPMASVIPSWAPEPLRRLVAAPSQTMAGDSDMPRVQGRRFGASQRLIVTPGREHEGIFHMPGGQAGHPLSPYYLKGHQDWGQGRASPLLAGESRWQLQLIPSAP
ncbi:penicillin acylase family protein [Paraferrimonas haliotis]|uniref:penicillin acylase family protein n=1 Tax=Paraferrimonas haliotis TaxID=2013866 RepID=UPI000BA931AC|nr:penicillin acylase family protein [Paraferrimonas haliotis]